MFAPLGTAYVLTILASLFIALMLTPAIGYTLLAGRTEEQEELRAYQWVKVHYAAILRQVEDHGTVALLVCGCFLMAELNALPFVSREYLPEQREGRFVLYMQTAPGTLI